MAAKLKDMEGIRFKSKGKMVFYHSKIGKPINTLQSFSLFKLSSSLLRVKLSQTATKYSATIVELQSLIKVDLSDGISN